MASRRYARVRGLSLIELMIAIVLGMIIVAALLALYVNVTRTNSELEKMNRQIENGRFAMQLLQDDVAHAGFWGSYVPQFDNLTEPLTPLDAPTALPDPCLAYSATNWNFAYLTNLIGIPVQGYTTPPTGCAALVTNQQANTDILVVRHAQTCVAGAAGCEADTAGKLYFQSTQCESEVTALAQAGAANSITLTASASATNDAYNGFTLRIIGGSGMGQSRAITAYNGTTKVATVSPNWVTVPDNSSIYAFGLGYAMGTSGYIFHKRNCTDLADKRKFVSDIYYIRNYAVNPGDGIPTLMRSSFDWTGGTPTQMPAEALIEGIQGFRVEYGIDSVSDSGAAVDYTHPIVWTDPLNKTSPTNRGDGVADGSYVDASGVTCNSVSDCKAANVVAVRIHVLARSLEATPGYTDSKTYTLGGTTMGPFNDGFKRHVFSTTVRLVNPAGRRDTP